MTEAKRTTTLASLSLPKVTLQESLKWAREHPKKVTPVGAKERISSTFLWLIVSTGLAFFVSSYIKKRGVLPPAATSGTAAGRQASTPPTPAPSAASSSVPVPTPTGIAAASVGVNSIPVPLPQATASRGIIPGIP